MSVFQHKMGSMSLTTDNTQQVPEWTIGWRLRRSLAHADLSIEDMAAELGVSRATVSRWLNERDGPPTRGYLIAFAMKCGVPLAWLLHGGSGNLRFSTLARAAA
jgi:transcriptional regulator with XRE-family HTH domain